MNQRLLLVALSALLAAGGGCRKRSKPGAPAPADGSTSAPATIAAPAEASAPADPVAAAAPLPPPTAEITVAVERRFVPAQSMNAYAPAQPGDYQAQLNLYNRVLRNWTKNAGNTPDTFEEIMASSGVPKPPQPPAGRRLTYDRRTVTVILQ